MTVSIKRTIAIFAITTGIALQVNAQQLVSNPGIEGPAVDNALAPIHARNSWGGVAAEAPGASFDRWWTGVNGGGPNIGGGYVETGGNPDGHFFGNDSGFINRFQIIDNRTNQYSGPAVFSVDRRWYDDDPTVGNTFLGVKWRIFGVNDEANLPSSYANLQSGSSFGIGDGTGDLLGEYNANDINGTSPGGDGITDTGAMGTEWHTQETNVSLGAAPYDFILISFRAGSTNFGDPEVAPSFDNVTLTLIPEPASGGLLALALGAFAFIRRKMR